MHLGRVARQAHADRGAEARLARADPREDGPRRGGAAHARGGVRVAAPRSLRTEEALALHKETTLEYRLEFS